MSSKIYIYGKHAITEALQHVPHAVKKVHIANGFDDKDVMAVIKQSGVATAPLQQGTIDSLDKASAHQGLVGIVSLGDLIIPFEKYIQSVTATADTSLVLLGEIQDPHNVGAIIRSAAAFGASAVLIPENNQAPVTGTVVKVSAGMAFRVPLVQIGNVNQTVRMLKDKGFWIYGLAGEGANSLTTEVFNAPAVFVVGNEGAGIRQKTRELCDILLKIPMHPRTESLNAAVSASVTLYAWSAQHPKALE